MIYVIRGKQVMLDSDLAKLYECKNGTKTINQAVKRHINRFPERFMFRLTLEEAKIFSRSQVGTLKGKGHNIKYLPYAFTEQGVAMLATVLRTPVAEEVSIRIMDAFVAMRKYISNDLIEHSKMLINHENRLALLENTFDSFKDKNILDILSETNRKVTLVTNKYNNIDYEKYKEQYNNVTLVVNNSFHDRFIILDKSILYHFGASFKDLG